MTVLSCPASPSVAGVRVITSATAGASSKIVDLEIAIDRDTEGDESESDDFEGALPSLPLATAGNSACCHDRSLPPLRELSVTSASSSCCSLSTSADDDQNDDEDSVSTISGDEETSQSRRRSIFNKYWEKNGGAPARLDHAVLPSSVVVETQPQNQQEEDTAAPVPNNKAVVEAGKRIIFGKGCWSRSEPMLTLAHLAAAHQASTTSFRKAQSDSSLQNSQPRTGSCLRRGRFSGSLPSPAVGDSANTTTKLRREQSCTSTMSTDSTVTFSNDVSVRVFQKSAERWAQEGWSKWFA